jgi:hypothetical protein
MFRDRLRQWGLNKKNRREALKGRIAKSSASNEEAIFNKRTPHHQTAGTRRSWSISLAIAGSPSVPKEARPLQRALKGMEDWQCHFDESGVSRDEILAYTDSFYCLLRNLSVALTFDRSSQQMCRSATRKLGEASAAFQSHLNSTCTPLAVLSSIQLILRIAGCRDSDPWHKSTSGFLLRTTTEILPGSHPTLLLLQALLVHVPAPEGLATIYEQGSSIVERCYSKSTAIDFRLDFVSAALDIHPHAAFMSNANTLSASTIEASIPRPLRTTDTARSQIASRRVGEAVAYGHSCLYAVRGWTDSGRRRIDRLGELYAWRILCNSKRMQCGFTGEETSQFNAHALIVAMANGEDRGMELGMKSLQVVRDLHSFYEEHDLDEQCETLRLAYPNAFGIRARHGSASMDMGTWASETGA